MQEDITPPTHPETPGWLERLQQESWQAEILISGGGFLGIASLMGTIGDIQLALQHGTQLSNPVVIFSVAGLIVLSLILAEGFLLHLVLRGYWIGLIGFNYVFPSGVDQEKLAFRGRFASFIKGNSNTPFLIKLDKICSLIFSFTFYIIFAFAGFIIFTTCIGLMSEFMVAQDSSGPYSTLIAIVFLSCVFFGILTLVDFFSFGYLKRIRWFSIVYYPVHYVISRITLSFLYRRLYYSIISNIKPLYIVLGLVIQILLLTVVTMNEYSLSMDISPNRSSENSFLTLKEDIVSGKSLEFSIYHFPRLEDDLFSEWKALNDTSQADSFDAIPKELKMDLIGGLYNVYIDTSLVKPAAWMIKERDVLGFGLSRLIYLADVQNIENGRHELTIRVRLRPKDYTTREANYYAKAYFMVDK